MSVDPWILSFSLVTVIATIFMGFWAASRSKTASDFFVAGRSVSVGWNASAISGEYLSAASFMGVAGMVMSSGYDALWYPVCYACGYLFLLLFIAGPLRRFGAYTIPDFAEGRYDSPIFRKIAVIFVMFIGFFYTMPQMKGAGTTLAYIFQSADLRGWLPDFMLAHDKTGVALVGLPYWVGVALVGAVITLNVALGGMKGITLVQAFQYWAKMFAISVPIFVLMSVYGHYGKQLEVNGANGEAEWNLTDEKRAQLFQLDGKPAPTTLELTQKKFDKMVREWKGLPTSPFPETEYETKPRIVQLQDRPLIWALKNYGELSGKTIVVVTNLPKVSLQINYPLPESFYTNKNREAVHKMLDDLRPDYFRYFESVLLTNGAALVNDGEITRAIRAEDLDAYKKDPSKFSFYPLTLRHVAGGGDVKHWLLLYQLMLEKPVLIPGNFPAKQIKIAPSAETVLLEQEAISFLSEMLKTNGVTLIPNSTEVWAIPIQDAPQYQVAGLNRKPLPEKAPADEKWISPFGPLTTKAIAKSAAANTHVDLGKRDLLANPNPVAETPAWTRNLEQLANGKLPEGAPRGPVKYGTGDEGKPLADLAIVIQHWAHLSSVLCESNLLAKNFVWNSTNYQSPAELMVSLEKDLNNHGVSVLRASDNEWWLVSSANVKSFLKPLDTKPYALLYTYSLIIALVCGTAGLPHILVRFYTNPDGVAAKRTTMWVMILIGIFYVFPPVFGVIGRNLMPELYTGLAGIKGTDQVVLKLPMLLNEKYGKLGSILSGITCAGAFAAFMSTFSGLLVSMTGALAHDVYGRILRPKSTPEQRMRMFKFGAVLIGAVAILLGMQVEQLEINFMVGQAFAIAAASYFPLLFMSVWWRGMTQKGAATGMLTGGLLALVGITLTSISDIALKNSATKGIPNSMQALENFWIAHPGIRILCEQPAIWAVPLAITLMIVVSKLTQKEVPPDVRMKMLVLHAPEKLGLKQEYIQEHQGMGH